MQNFTTKLNQTAIKELIAKAHDRNKLNSDNYPRWHELRTIAEGLIISLRDNSPISSLPIASQLPLSLSSHVDAFYFLQSMKHAALGISLPVESFLPLKDIYFANLLLADECTRIYHSPILARSALAESLYIAFENELIAYVNEFVYNVASEIKFYDYTATVVNGLLSELATTIVDAVKTRLTVKGFKYGN